MSGGILDYVHEMARRGDELPDAVHVYDASRWNHLPDGIEAKGNNKIVALSHRRVSSSGYVIDISQAD